jgi:hypothetical protein
MATNNETISVLLDLFRSGNTDLLAAATGAVMSISIDVEAKKLLVRENVIPLLKNLLGHENELVQLNALKAITNCAEDYRGRFQLTQSTEKLKNIARTSMNKNIVEAATKAIDVITWRP